MLHAFRTQWVAVAALSAVIVTVIPALARSTAVGTATRSAPPPCRPLDGAWALAAQVTDAANGAPLPNVFARDDRLRAMASTDSAGWICLRALKADSLTLHVSRLGYERTTIGVSGRVGETTTREIRVARVPRPCCDLRARWYISMTLLRSGDMGPVPKDSTATGEVMIGPHVVAPQQGDDEDSIVHVVRGLHTVNFSPMFGGPVAPDVSRSVFGGGPDLLHEVQGVVSRGDSVQLVFIPRMSHGSIVFAGRIRADTVRGTWRVSAYGRGAEGTWTMIRAGAVDTTPVPPTAPTLTRRRATVSAEVTPAGTLPEGRWRPQLAVAPDGRLWLATGGLHAADSLGAAWHRVLGGNVDPVGDDELRIGIKLAFVGHDTAVLGLPTRYELRNAPVLYRTTDRGRSWTSVKMPGAFEVDALDACSRTMWAVVGTDVKAVTLFRSRDGGRTWETLPPPPAGRAINGIHCTSDSTAFLFASAEPGKPALWQTGDGGQHWTVLPTPNEQGLLRLGVMDSRIEEIATVGRWIVVREHGSVFASPADRIAWRALPAVTHVASEPGGAHAFVLVDSLVPALLDGQLQIVQRADRPLSVKERGDIEQVMMRNGVGYVSESGSVHEFRAGRIRVIRRARQE